MSLSFSHEDAGINFSPDDFGVTEALITNAVQGAVGLLSSLPRVLHTRSFVPFYEGKPSGTRLELVVRCHLLSSAAKAGSPVSKQLLLLK